MSAIASFIFLPKAKLDGLREAATPRKAFFGTPKDTYEEYLDQHGRSVANYCWSGYVLATLLPYLEERHNIDLMRSTYSELGEFLAKQREATHFIFTNEHKQAYFDKLSPEAFSAEELCNYYNEFNAAEETEVGEPMLDGIRVFQECLALLNPDSVIIFRIG